MRRRTLLSGGGSIEYVFSAQSTSVNIGYSSSSTNVNIKSTANGTNIGYSVVSYDGKVVIGYTTAATYVTIYYSANTTDYQRNSNVVLKQNDSNKTITINFSQSAQPLDLGYGGILLDGTSGSYGSFSFDSQVTFSNVPSWATVTYSSGKINVTATTTNSASTARTADILVNRGSRSGGFRIIQLPSDYHSRNFVDMGGTNWAIKNVGASSVQDYGNYYKYGYGSQQYESSYDYYEGNEEPLAYSADTAAQVLGTPYRMPTREQFSALVRNTYYWVSYNGVNGGVFYSGGNVLFFPAAGYYYNGSIKEIGEYSYVWTSTPGARNDIARCFNCYASSKYGSSGSRYNGYSVRGVSDAA